MVLQVQNSSKKGKQWGVGNQFDLISCQALIAICTPSVWEATASVASAICRVELALTVPVVAAWAGRIRAAYCMARSLSQLTTSPCAAANVIRSNACARSIQPQFTCCSRAGMRKHRIHHQRHCDKLHGRAGSHAAKTIVSGGRLWTGLLRATSTCAKPYGLSVLMAR